MTHTQALQADKDRTARAHATEALSHYPDYLELGELKRREQEASWALDVYLDYLDTLPAQGGDIMTDTRIYVYAEHAARAGQVVADPDPAYGNAAFDAEGNPLHTDDFILWGEGTDGELAQWASQIMADNHTNVPLFSRTMARNVLAHLGRVGRELTP